MIRPLAALAAAATVAAIVTSRPAPAHAVPTPILGGSADTLDTAVGIVEAGSASCSGTLIAPTIVLTAAHCVAAAPTAVTVTLDDGSYTATATTFPSFNLPTALDGDLAVLVLDHASTLPPLPFADTVVANGDHVVVVGYGSDAGSVERRSAANTIAVVNGPRFEIDGSANACADDAGGPVLTAGASPAIVGVISAASATCATAAGTSDHVRTTAYLPWIAGLAPGATVVGGGPLPMTDTAPTIVVTRPGDGAIMPATFRVDVRVGDDFGALSVSVSVDGTAGGAVDVTGALVAVPLMLAVGTHTIVATVTDATAHTATAMVNVDVPQSSFVPGQSGAPCWDATDCVAGQCSIHDGQQFCTNACALDTSCAPGMYCDTTTDLCVLGSDAGCCESSAQPPPWIAFAGVLLWWFGVARRRR